jgi:hypothetical protein
MRLVDHEFCSGRFQAFDCDVSSKSKRAWLYNTFAIDVTA